jgi:hypothetical protein
MKPILLIGIVLILFGIVALSYEQITYTTKERLSTSGHYKLQLNEKNQFLCHRYWAVWRWSRVSA